MKVKITHLCIGVKLGPNFPKECLVRTNFSCLFSPPTYLCPPAPGRSANGSPGARFPGPFNTEKHLRELGGTILIPGAFSYFGSTVKYGTTSSHPPLRNVPHAPPGRPARGVMLLASNTQSPGPWGSHQHCTGAPARQRMPLASRLVSPASSFDVVVLWDPLNPSGQQGTSTL